MLKWHSVFDNESAFWLAFEPPELIAKSVPVKTSSNFHYLHLGSRCLCGGRQFDVSGPPSPPHLLRPLPVTQAARGVCAARSRSVCGSARSPAWSGRVRRSMDAGSPCAFSGSPATAPAWQTRVWKNSEKIHELRVGTASQTVQTLHCMCFVNTIL